MIQIENISKSYKDIKALSDITFTLQKGDIVGLLGANGAGKSTLMKILSGLIPADDGEVVIYGQDVKTMSVKLKKAIGFLSEDNPLYDHMYVKEYLSFVANLYGKGEKEAREILEKVGLENEYKKKIKTLSKGNRQRVGIAQVLVQDPDFIILDEPTAGLDPNQRDKLNALFVELSKEKIMLFSTHILQDVKDICSRIILMNKGRIVKDENIKHIDSIENIFRRLTDEDNS